MSGFLEAILQRKREEVGRRRRHMALVAAALSAVPDDGADRGPAAIEALRRRGAPVPRIIAEIKHRSPSTGTIRPRAPGAVAALARSYADHGAAAVSVLADGPGFGGSPLDVRRASAAVSVPVLFKEFVLDEVQVPLARAVGASLVLLLVRVLDDAALARLVTAIRRAGMEPVVEGADRAEVDRALRTGATIVGVNARDLSTFIVDVDAAADAVDAIPEDRVAVLMSGIKTPVDVARAAATQTNALLVGEALMRAPNPGERLAELRRG